MSVRRQIAIVVLALASISMAACTSPTAPTHNDGTYEGSGN
jgi:hypothetical protein